MSLNAKVGPWYNSKKNIYFLFYYGGTIESLSNFLSYALSTYWNNSCSENQQEIYLIYK